MRKIFLFIISSCLLNVGILPVLAVGVGATPSFIEVELEVRETVTEELKVKNISQEAAMYEVYADELGEWIELEPNNFRLEAGETRSVQVKITALEAGQQATHLSLVAHPLDRRSFNAGSGLKIPLRLSVSDSLASKQSRWLLAGLLVIAFLIIVPVLLGSYFFRRRSLRYKIWQKMDLLVHYRHRAKNPLRWAFWKRVLRI